MKKRILFCSEASYMATGYSIMYQNIIKDFWDSSKYEVAEHGAYGKITDHRAALVPWKFYANGPTENQPQLTQEYNSKEANKFGAWRFNQVALDFRPDIVFSCRDIYMDTHILYSPLAKYFHTIVAPPIDSHPQRDEFLELYQLADSMLVQTKYAEQVLLGAVPDIKHYGGIMSAGVDLNTFYPRNKALIRQKHGLNENLLIFGMVGRNQPRKLFPNLIEAFSIYLSQVDKATALKSFLYLHTAYPDREGWNIPKIIKEFNVGHKILFSYECSACKAKFPSIFSDSRIICKSCGQLSAKHPTPAGGYSRDDLAELYSMMDLYLQIANCEGLGITQLEAAACGTHLASMDFGPMGEVVDNFGGFKIKPACVMRDMKNDSYRCCPDNADIARVMLEFAAGKRYDIDKQFEALKQLYNFRDVSAFIMRHIDGLQLTKKWDAPYTPHNIPTSYPENLSNVQFVDYLYNDILGEPALRKTFTAFNIERDLHYGVAISDGTIKPISRENLCKFFADLAQKKQYFESIRVGQQVLPQSDYLMFANRPR